MNDNNIISEIEVVREYNEYIAKTNGRFVKSEHEIIYEVKTHGAMRTQLLDYINKQVPKYKLEEYGCMCEVYHTIALSLGYKLSVSTENTRTFIRTYNNTEEFSNNIR